MTDEITTTPGPTAADQSQPVVDHAGAAQQQQREAFAWALRSRYDHSEERLGMAIADAGYTAEVLGLSEQEIDGYLAGAGGVEQLEHAAGLAAGLRATAHLTPAEAEVEWQAMLKRPGLYSAMDANPALLDRWRALSVRRGMAK